MDMFIVWLLSMIKRRDEINDRVGESTNEDSILRCYKVQKEIRQRCSERIEDYRHKLNSICDAALRNIAGCRALTCSKGSGADVSYYCAE